MATKKVNAGDVKFEFIDTPVSENNESALYYITDIGRCAYSLMKSGIITFENPSSLTWRTGHLEHIANLYKGDPRTTERDYADDLAVVRAYSAELWEALIDG